MITVLIGVLVFFSAALIDFANTRYVLAVGAHKVHVAARWSVLQWASSLVGFLVAIKITLWMLPIEMVGLYAGTWWSMRTKRQPEVLEGYADHLQRRGQDQVPGVPAQRGGGEGVPCACTLCVPPPLPGNYRG